MSVRPAFRLLAPAALLCGVALFVSGCTSEVSPPSPTRASVEPPTPEGDRPTWSQLLDLTIGGEGAKISPDAAAILAESAQSGEVTRMQVARAAELSRACVERAGMNLSLTVPVDDFAGYEAQVRLDMGADGDDSLAEQLGLIAQACLDENLYAVELLYLQQPAATEANDAKRDAHFEEFRPAVVDCLAEAGYQTDIEAPQSEIRETLAQEATANGAHSCLFTTGFAG